jgi:HPt (histidine-containing phosphotransfer) domain-containing protein
MLSPFILDRASILERLGGDEEIFTMMVDMFLGDAQNNCAALLAAQAAQDGPLLQREAHTIKGLLSTFSDDAGAEMAFALEQRAKLRQLDGAGERVEQLVRRMQEVAATLSAL